MVAVVKEITVAEATALKHSTRLNAINLDAVIWHYLRLKAQRLLVGRKIKLSKPEEPEFGREGKVQEKHRAKYHDPTKDK